MSLQVSASRFAILPDDDTTDWIAPKPKKGSKDAANGKAESAKGTKGKGGQAKNDAKELQALAFGGSANKKKSKKKPVKQVSKDSTQFEEWKQKDVEFTDDQFASELEQAILQSKVDYEEKRDFYEHVESPSKKPAQPISKKPVKLSLEEFNNLNLDQVDNLQITSPKNGAKTNQAKSPSQEEVDFFAKLDEDTRKALTREQLLDSYRISQKHLNSDSALMEHFKSSIEEKNREISTLQDSNQTLKSDLTNVKKRYKKLRDILDQCEMREKAEIIVENEKLKTIRDELMSEVTRLNEELEQMKTRVADFGKDVRKNQAKRMSENKPN